MGKKIDKKTLILDAMEKLLLCGKGVSASVSEIAKTAGIGKGSIYYYFQSKEEIAEALIARIYGGFIERCQSVLRAPLSAPEKLKLLFGTYYSESADSAADAYLHLPQNADMHQKSLARIVLGMAPVVTQILEQGAKEGSLTCGAPREYAEILLTVLAFLFDYGIFEQKPAEAQKKLKAFAEILEKSLCAPKDSFSFLYDSLPRVRPE